jgi:hypothetical protein
VIRRPGRFKPLDGETQIVALPLVSPDPFCVGQAAPVGIVVEAGMRIQGIPSDIASIGFVLAIGKNHDLDDGGSVSEGERE